MNAYIEVPRDSFAAAMAAAGFEMVEYLSDEFGELVYRRGHRLDRRFCITIYSSVPTGGEVARRSGTDAIRIHAHFEWQVGPEVRRKNLHRAKVLRVNSVQGTIDRTVQAARDAYDACNQYRKEKLL